MKVLAATEGLASYGESSAVVKILMELLEQIDHQWAQLNATQVRFLRSPDLKDWERERERDWDLDRERGRERGQGSCGSST